MDRENVSNETNVCFPNEVFKGRVVSVRFVDPRGNALSFNSFP